MTLALEQLPGSDSLVCRLDPRWKLAAVVLAVVAVAMLRTLPAAATALAAVLFLAALSRLPPRWCLSRLAAALLLLGLFAVSLPFLVHGPGPAWDVGPVHISLYGVTVALLLCAKAVAILLLMLTLLATADLSDTLKAAHALHVPGLIVQLVVLTYRYLFVLSSELARLRVALRVRGYRNRATRHSYRTVGHVAGTLLVRGYERAERVGQAMRCRGFDGRFRSLTGFRTRLPDVLFFLAVVTGAAALLAWDLLRR
jgi:cobalt/nickel transport system permease protein